MVKSSRDLYQEFLKNYPANPMLAPRLIGVVVSAGCGRFSKNQSVLESIYNDMSNICAQKPIYSKAKKSISNFGIRDNYIVGVYATLRSRQMFDFLDRLLLVALPRVQDLQRLSMRSFDSSNNYNFGIKRQDIFPEADNTNHYFGMNIAIKIKSQDKSNSADLLTFLGFPMNVPSKGGVNAN